MRSQLGIKHAAPLAVLLLSACNPGKGKTAYIGATLWDGTGSPPIPKAVVVVDQTGHVERAGAPETTGVPRGATEVRLDGKWIIPGLIDAHAHTERWTLSRFLAYGVTAVRDVGGQQDSIVRLRNQVSLGGTPGPRLYISGAMIDGKPATWRTATAVSTSEAARKAVDTRTLFDASQAKVYTKIDSTLLAAILDEASTVSLPVTGHLGKVDAVTAGHMGINAIEHMSGVVEASVSNRAPLDKAHNEFFPGWNLAERTWATLDSARLQRTADALKKSGVAIIPTLALHQTWAHLEDSTFLVTLDLAGVPDSIQKAWDLEDLIARARVGHDDYAAFQRSRPAQDLFVRMYHRAGGLVAAGSDAPNQLLPPGASLHEELALLVTAGLTPREALIAATRDAARLLRVDSIGVLRRGGVADFVVLSGSPLEDIANTRKIEAVVARGVMRRENEIRAMWRARPGGR
jgi:imidazolonepropionase-like amidohydrolase